MGAGARLAEERDRWTADWRAIDLDQEAEQLLDLLDGAEELQAAVPGVRMADRGGDVSRHEPVLIGVTDRRVLVVGRWGAAEACRLTFDGDDLQLDAAARARLRAVV